MSTTKTTKTIKNSTFTFTGTVHSFYSIPDSTNRLVAFDTLNKDKTKLVRFTALLTDSEIFLKSYIVSSAIVNVVVKELEPEDGKRRFEIVSMMTPREQSTLERLKAYDAEVETAKVKVQA